MSDDVVKLGPTIVVTRQMLTEAAATRAALDQGFDRYFNPWKYPDPNPMPPITPMPLLARLSDAWHSLAEIREQYLATKAKK